MFFDWNLFSCKRCGPSSLVVHRLMSVVVYIFIFRTTGPILTTLCKYNPLVTEIQLCLIEGPRPFPREIITKKTLNTCEYLLKNHWTDFNSTWHKSSLAIENLSLFNERLRPCLTSYIFKTIQYRIKF